MCITFLVLIHYTQIIARKYTMINVTILQFYWNRIRKKIPLVKSLPLSAKSLSVNDLVEAEDGLGDGENCCLRPTVDFAGDLLLEVKNFVEQCFAFYL